MFGHLPTTGGVYAIINTKTGDMYVGASKNIRARAYLHLSKLRSCKKKGTRLTSRLHRHFARCRADILRFVVLTPHERDGLHRLEWRWIWALNPSLNSDYMVPGGCSDGVNASEMMTTR